ncbi:hypothetical protein Hanom_Chr00s000348g01638251 [Helianthus anomalus]
MELCNVDRSKKICSVCGAVACYKTSKTDANPGRRFLCCQCKSWIMLNCMWFT